MNKLALIAVITSVVTLTACSKPVTTVKDGESPAPKTTTAPTNSITALEQDIAAIQTFGLSQEQEAAALQQRLGEAMQQKDQATLKKLFGEFRAFVESSNQKLQQLPLQSSDAKLLRQKMVENSQISLEMSEVILAKGSQEAAIQAAEFQPLQAKARQAQQELSAISEQIYVKLHGQPAQAPAMPQQPIDNAQ